jgi:hypothetical protein
LSSRREKSHVEDSDKLISNLQCACSEVVGDETGIGQTWPLAREVAAQVSPSASFETTSKKKKKKDM